MTGSRKNKKEDQEIKIGRKYSLHSKVLGEQRPYWVHLPGSYDEGSKGRRYPVLYLLDGDSHFPSASGALHFMSSGINGNTQIPEMILVAIPNTNRTRDLTPTHSTTGIAGEQVSALDPSGGGEAFLKFMREELFPEIDSRFHTLPIRILVGHSFGGLLAIHALLNQPELFQAYIAIDPSLWWDKQLLKQQARDKVKTLKKLRESVYISSANSPRILNDNPDRMRKTIRAFVKTLEAAQSAKFRLKFQFFDSENHGSVPLLSLYHGLLFVFEGFQFAGVESLPAMQARFQRLSRRLGGDILPSEGSVNAMGYMMLYEKHDLKKAMAFFAYNVAQFPRSGNAYDSLAEGYMVKGDKARAARYYRKSLELDPGNQNAARVLSELKARKETSTA